MADLALHGTPLSHFSRKIRVLLAELGVPFEFVRAPGVLGTTATTYGDNPLLRVPTLVHDGATIIESDHIARHLVAHFDPADRLGVRRDEVEALNRLAVANGVMADEVVLILARRGGLADLESVAYFRKLFVAIDSGLAWLDAHTPPDAAPLDYADIAAICLWQHLAHYGLVKEPGRYPRLDARVARFADRPSIASTTPAVSLAEATAAGWKPA
jgi:glutathione S-transferase